MGNERWRFGGDPSRRWILSLLAVVGFASLGCGDDDAPIEAVDSGSPAPDGGMPAGDGGATTSCPLLGSALPEALEAPPARGDTAFAFDPECQRVFMFFGDQAIPVNCGFPASDFLADGFAFDLATQQWSTIEVEGGAGPTPRARARAVWDERRGRLILFGGRHRDGDSGPYTFFNDLWAFDPDTRTWEELSPAGAAGGPTGRMNFTLDADPDRDQILVHAGGTTDFVQFFVDSQTWAFDLEQNTWSQRGATGPQPPSRLFHMSAFDRSRGRLFIFSGGGTDAFISPTFFRDMWFLDVEINIWTQVPMNGPFPLGRIKGEMSYDVARDRLLLFGGHDDGNLGNNNDVWTFDLESLTWAEEKTGDAFNRGPRGFCDFPGDFATPDLESPERRESHLFLLRDNTAVMYGGRTDCGLANDTWTLDLETLAWSELNYSPTGMTCFRTGNVNCAAVDSRMCQ